MHYLLDTLDVEGWNGLAVEGWVVGKVVVAGGVEVVAGGEVAEGAGWNKC